MYAYLEFGRRQLAFDDKEGKGMSKRGTFTRHVVHDRSVPDGLL
jgi:hypothetical protein